MSDRRSKIIQLVLVSHTAVDYLPCQGAGIGIVQRAECALTGHVNHKLIPVQERGYGISRQCLVVENIKTSRRARLLAIVHALGLIYGTIRRGYPKAVHLRKVIVLSDEQEVVQSINHHIKHAPNSLVDVTSTCDRSMIKRVIAGVRRLKKHGLEVSLAVSSREDNSRGRAVTIARQKGRQACISRRRLQRTQNNESAEEWDDLDDTEDIPAEERTLELVIRTKSPSKDLPHESATYNE